MRLPGLAAVALFVVQRADVADVVELRESANAIDGDQGDHKLILYPQIGTILLYNLKDDPEEMNNLADDPQHVETVKKLFAKLSNFRTKRAMNWI